MIHFRLSAATLFVTALLGQQMAATLVGTATDPSGSVLTGVSVRVTNVV